jgi:hypothetical protein
MSTCSTCGKCSAVPRSPPETHSGEVLTLSKNKVRYHGHIVAFYWITNNTENLKVVRKCPISENKHGIRSFLGPCTYYRPFIYGFANVAKMLTKLTEEEQVLQ